MSIPLGVVAFFSAALLLGVFRPRLIVVLPLLFHAAYLVRFTLPLGGVLLPLTLLEVLIGAAILVVLLTDGPQRVLRAVRSLPTPVLLASGLFLLSATVSAVIAPHPRTAWGQWKAFVVEPMAYAFALAPLFRTADGRRSVGAALLLGGMVSAGLSLLAGSYCLLPTAYYCPATADFGRLLGIYDVPNSLALVLAPLSAGASVLAVPRAPSPHRRLARWSLLIFLPALLLTQSLGGLAAAVLALVLVWGGSRNLLPLREADRNMSVPPVMSAARVRWPIIFLGILLAVGGLLLQTSSGKLRHAVAANSPLAARLQIWQVSLALVRDHPLLGTGLGTFEPAYQDKLHEILAASPAFPVQEWVVRDPHNILLSFWLNFGLLGALTMGGLVVYVLRQQATGNRQQDRVPTAYCLVPTAAKAALLALLIFGLVDVPYLKNDLSLLWWALLAAAPRYLEVA